MDSRNGFRLGSTWSWEGARTRTDRETAPCSVLIPGHSATDPLLHEGGRNGTRPVRRSRVNIEGRGDRGTKGHWHRVEQEVCGSRPRQAQDGITQGARNLPGAGGDSWGCAIRTPYP